MNNTQPSHQDPRDWLPYVMHTLQRSPLYAHLSQCMEQDADLLAFRALIDPDQPAPILFFTLVNDLLFRERDHPLAAFYPYLTASPQPATEAYPLFRQFCLEHGEELRARLPLVRLQTNEVTRCANLLPAFHLIFEDGGQRPLALVEVGASAGLNLNWMYYHYEYGTHQVGDPASPVRIRCELAGALHPPLPVALPPVANCLGIERVPLALHNEEDVRWLRACIWPEERERYQVLDAALAMAHRIPPPLLIGEAADLLSELLATLPLDQTVCVWHSYALNQGPVQTRARIEHLLADASSRRTIYRLSLEVEPQHRGEAPRLELFTYRHGTLSSHDWLANCALHGEWLEWCGPNTCPTTI
ncbi:MAG TPA: DUF2332 domain-containing protein [Ktedonobacteraceae bacterium]|nr:DUF2332 domain-containing protein [Ktedonobacteraceae bacterium]